MARLFLAAGVALGLAAGPAVALQQGEVPGKEDVSRVKAGTYKVDPAHTQIMFEVDHLGFSVYYGLIGDATGTLVLDPANPSAAKVDIEIPMSGITTTSAKLTEHLKNADFFDVAKFPTARFVSTSVQVDGTDAKISGNLTIKGVTRPVVLDAEFTGAGLNAMVGAETVGFEAETMIRRSDFGINYGIPMVGDEVALNITVAFEKPVPKK